MSHRLYGEEMADNSKPIAQALLDLYSGFVPDGGEEINGPLLKSIMDRMNELGAVRVEETDDGEFMLDASATVNAIVYLEHYLFDRVAKAEGVDTASVVFDARQFVESLDL